MVSQTFEVLDHHQPSKCAMYPQLLMPRTQTTFLVILQTTYGKGQHPSIPQSTLKHC